MKSIMVNIDEECLHKLNTFFNAILDTEGKGAIEVNPMYYVASKIVAHALCDMESVEVTGEEMRNM